MSFTYREFLNYIALNYIPKLIIVFNIYFFKGHSTAEKIVFPYIFIIITEVYFYEKQIQKNLQNYIVAWDVQLNVETLVLLKWCFSEKPINWENEFINFKSKSAFKLIYWERISITWFLASRLEFVHWNRLFFIQIVALIPQNSEIWTFKEKQKVMNQVNIFLRIFNSWIFIKLH